MASQEGGGSPPARGGSVPPDWDTLERSPELGRLSARRRRFVVPALIFVAVVYGGFLVLAAWGRGFMASSVHRGFTVAYAFGLVLIVTVWVIAWLYVRLSDRTLTPMIDGVMESAGAPTGQQAPGAGAASIGGLERGEGRDDS